MKEIISSLRDNVKAELLMSVVLLLSVSFIACNMNNVEKKKAVKKDTVKWNGYSIVIDPGHGGKDPGKVGVTGSKEADINLQIGLKLREKLNEKGYRTAMTRSSQAVNDDNSLKKTEELRQRCEIINKVNEANDKTILVSIHQNSYVKEHVKGPQCFCYKNSKEGRRLANIVQGILNEEINKEKPKEVKENDSYYILLNTTCPAVIVECGFLSNKEEEQSLMSDEYQNKIVEMIINGLDKYRGNEEESANIENKD